MPWAFTKFLQKPFTLGNLIFFSFPKKGVFWQKRAEQSVCLSFILQPGMAGVFRKEKRWSSRIA